METQITIYVLSTDSDSVRLEIEVITDDINESKVYQVAVGGSVQIAVGTKITHLVTLD